MFLAPGTSFIEDSFSMHRGGRDDSDDNVSDGGFWGAVDEVLPACPSLTSCCVEGFLTGCGLMLVTPNISNIM